MEENLSALYDVILQRKNNGEEGSYTNYLFEKGLDKILKKVGEECTEVIISCKDDNKEDQINEICDLTYHLLVLMAEIGISTEDISKELGNRRAKINNFKGDRKPITNV
ncbi:phosphoribosyl-ATP diphosphatase [Clostridium saccharobutylicum]|uniref:Phosphoribosyl-ATP pyrophosphatase n=1 Tax=Clostridium saccharobutylicum DSM 13864 TaxID=1345695 RepID=U5MU90_CLOSA|nr:phosphoribosyl-ATP diphosphatase [Clostridium saccharobutylicum]AGX44093.1 phosphoribosyl-ATP pyrophosphatase HisE [Clostridium saccharobutylicum DSM 13864]AQR91383.1 phosphoribosyl-ATP pyrophosphatase [Clostridium saccharobutylicum]AQS01287.1 phosphoribosyl-ATP pyrophosphatase [Clostridium saccharobutylicum]AQS10897.1 phosphoribosyl-ATP pyrophosphatase [Clostridium saccharobutylicum]AQS15270.1 phosphoribosyl-ATP pyrophosphatase [Clostridium saccharobutylicum]